MTIFDGSTAFGRPVLFASLIGVGITLGGCQDKGSAVGLDDVTSSVKFDEKTYGVPASPRVAERTARNIEKGGGRAMVGKPYKIKGKWYYPKDEPGYVGTGTASWYGPNFHGRLTANGETYDMRHLSAAHKTFPLPSYAMVTNLDNGRKVKVRINDRGPYAHGREIDLSQKAAELLDFKHKGVANVRVEYIGRAPVEGDDTRMLMASYSDGGGQPQDMMVASSQLQESPPVGASAYSALDAAPVPGVRPMRELFQNQPSRTGDLIDTLSSFRSEANASGATQALKALGTASGPRTEKIHLGTIDRALMATVGKVIGVGTSARAEDTGRPGLVSATVTAAPNVDKDRLLQKLWSAGFTDAFPVRD
ncbi:septal ring lytic transglycosylase RlpA family protein [Fulvimarina sp. 2208YS6-2-32]|uniref:Endolytic peptidoglycan transglycosylase RlpA n=1 Tax=Fulvimarina uroteuthidis TaxID=3098149 RepID=A0ABU5I547_9HYPH|nr:septal ring lytic transglycosylase RlpA family protein [Fulvimarina sp. 2208YS6-2-32]MDY8110497.1 septal ring lytic transglycosylase RlpA family protein [Fulvimarina sp. 2208YS6-2-32]